MTPIRFILRTSQRAGHHDIVLTGAVAPTQHAELTSTSQLLVAEHDHLIDLGSTGFVIGYLFDRSSSKRLRHLPLKLLHNADPAELTAWLIRECWGSYVALFHDRGTILVLPDPSGLLPCYVMSDHEQVMCTSDLDMIAQSTGRRPVVSWANLKTHLQRPDLRTADSDDGAHIFRSDAAQRSDLIARR